MYGQFRLVRRVKRDPFHSALMEGKDKIKGKDKIQGKDKIHEPNGHSIVQRRQQALQQRDHCDHPRGADGRCPISSVNLDSGLHIHAGSGVRWKGVVCWRDMVGECKDEGEGVEGVGKS